VVLLVGTSTGLDLFVFMLFLVLLGLLLFWLMFVFVLMLRLLPLLTYGVVGDGKDVEATEAARPEAANEVRPGCVGIPTPLGADIILSDREEYRFEEGTLDPRMTTGD